MSQDSGTGTSASGARTFCSAKKCVPCNTKDLRPMTEQSAQELLQKVGGWDMANDNGTLKLHRSWTVKSFTKGLGFFSRVAKIAELEGGLTENDFILAAKINELEVEDLLRKKIVVTCHMKMGLTCASSGYVGLQTLSSMSNKLLDLSKILMLIKAVALKSVRSTFYSRTN